MLHFSLDILYFVKDSILDKTCCLGRKTFRNELHNKPGAKKQQTRGNDQDK